MNDYIKNVQDYFDKTGFHIRGMGLLALFFSLIIPAALEEVGKFYIFKKITERLSVLKSVTSCIFAIIYVAIGFAFFETGAYVYFLSLHSDNDSLIMITGVRVIISTLSHIFFSAIIGYYF